MSEPDAGSDLAGLRTRADARRRPLRRQRPEGVDLGRARRRRHPRLRAHRPRRAQAQGHQRAWSIPTDLPGLTRRPFGSIVGPDDLDFNEVFFDDVRRAGREPDRRAPRRAGGSPPARSATSGRCSGSSFAERLAAPDRGGRPARSHERGLAEDPLVLDGYGTAASSTASPAPARLPHPGQGPAGHGAGRAVDPQAVRVGGRAGRPPGDARDAGHRRPRPHAAVVAPVRTSSRRSFTASWFDIYLRSFAGTIAGGTSQIQRNIVAQHVLGLPR